jgi:transmembrane sensor
VFAANKREVYLTGEAFFEVTKNPKRPFYVHASELITRVLGTSFSVMAFNGDKQFRVVVNTGKVAVYRNSVPEAEASKEGVLVTPNQQAVFYRKEEKMVKNALPKPTLLSREISQKIFNFNQTPFSKVISTLNEAYGINIDYNKNLSNCLLTASLTDQPLYEKLDLICKAVEAKYDIIDGEIDIDGKGCQNQPIIQPTN